MASIRLQNISRRFPGNSQALDNVSFEIHDCQVVTVVGPSGCGKSTLLRLIAGLDFPSKGTILIDEKPMHSVPARLRNLAMVFQSYALYPHMTCYENLALNLRLKRIPQREIDQRVQETARLLEIDDLLAKQPRELSGGQRQRVAVGRALIRKPKAFLFDEPLSNLDALLRERVRHELKALFKKLNATVVYVTHDQVEAMTLADRVVVLDHGRVQQVGTPQELYNHPANRFVAAFIGSPSMNIFTIGTVSPPAVTTYIEEDTRSIFQNGRAVFLRNWPYVWTLIQQRGGSIKDEIGIMPMVHAPGRSGAATLGGWGFAISKFCPTPKRAWQFVEFITRPEQLKIVQQQQGRIPSRKSLIPAAFSSILYSARMRPRIPEYAQTSDILQRWLSAALTGQVSIEKALKEAARETQLLLAE